VGIYVDVVDEVDTVDVLIATNFTQIHAMRPDPLSPLKADGSKFLCKP
jgi:hypothetical protein